MKKHFIITFVVLALNISTYAQIDAPTNITSVGLVATTNNSNYKFTYQNYSIVYYALGWYTETFGSPAAYLSGYAGIKFSPAGYAQRIYDKMES